MLEIFYIQIKDKLNKYMLQKLCHEPKERERDRSVSYDGQKQINMYTCTTQCYIWT